MAGNTSSNHQADGHRHGVPDVNQVIAEAEKAVRDGAYIAVGAGILAFQRAQVQRRQLAKELEKLREGRPEDAAGQLTARLDEIGRSLSANAGATRAQLREIARSWDAAIAPTRRQMGERADALQSRLPSPAREVLAGARSAVSAPEARLRAALGLD